jgi:hypothetical protein
MDNFGILTCSGQNLPLPISRLLLTLYVNCAKIYSEKSRSESLFYFAELNVADRVSTFPPLPFPFQLGHGEVQRWLGKQRHTSTAPLKQLMFEICSRYVNSAKPGIFVRMHTVPTLLTPFQWLKIASAAPKHDRNIYLYVYSLQPSSSKG